MSRIPRIIGGLALIIGLIMISGCGSEQSQSPPDKNVSSGFPVMLQDDLGRQVTIEKEPQRIVSLSPSNTEILYAIGLDSRVAGVTTYCNYPAAAGQCKKIGGFSDPNLEMIVALDPDLVVVESIHRLQIPALEEAGIPVLALEPERLEDISGAVEMIGRATGKQREAKRLADDIREKIEQVRNAVAGDSYRPLVYYEVWHEPLMTVGPGTLIDDLITACGGFNLAGDAATHYPELSAEIVILRNPDIIVYQESHGVPASNPMNRGSGWQSIKAIQNGQVTKVDPDIFNRAGPRIIRALDELLSIIHPEIEVRGD
ncbi:MAG: ABC transporter substrate-binding protein [Syntrophomonadales bacterium]|jgi:iron complex transport system substrate-binding protein